MKSSRNWSRVAAIHQFDLSWVEGLRKDFLTLLKNLPRIKDYETAAELRDAFRIYRDNFESLMFTDFLNELRNYSDLPQDIVEGINAKLRKPAGEFEFEMRLPLGYPDEYRSKERVFRDYQEEVSKWKARIQRKGQVFWKEMKEALELFEPGRMQARRPTVDKAQIEGFQLVMRSYDPDDQYHRQELEIFKEGLKMYRQRASSVMPLLLAKQLPLIIEFKAELDKGGVYKHSAITFYASSALSNGPKWVVHALAHEMGHHLFETYLSGGARDFWNTAIKGNYGDLDIQELIDKWPGTAWASEFPKVLGEKDPILALQVAAIGHADRNKRDLQQKEDFQKLLDQGTKTLRVPKIPITGYANKNPEEAFCETIGLLVAYGPRAVHEDVQLWLSVVLPGDMKLASAHRVAARFASANR